jgi:undecaprenyl-diphosphatase
MNGPFLVLAEMDGRLFRAVVERRRPLVDALMRSVTRLGNVEVIAPVTLALALGAVKPLREAGVAAFWSGALSHAFVQLLKRRVARERPSLPVGSCFLIEPEDRFSFPSGHATAGLSVALPIFFALGGPLGLLALALGATIGVSRCYLGVHYPGDVAAGWLLAGLAVLLVSLG